MTNSEKFKLVFGFEPDTNMCPKQYCDCEHCDYATSDRGYTVCANNFWADEYINSKTFPLAISELIQNIQYPILSDAPEVSTEEE